jgi:hypothetical protein
MPVRCRQIHRGFEMTFRRSIRCSFHEPDGIGSAPLAMRCRPVPAAGFRRPAYKPAAHICRADRIDTNGGQSRVGCRCRCFMLQVRDWRRSTRIRHDFSGRNRSAGHAGENHGQESSIESAHDPVGRVLPFLGPAGSCVAANAHALAASVVGVSLSPAALQVLDCAKDALPDGDADDVANQTQFIDPLGGSRHGVRPVVCDQ